MVGLALLAMHRVAYGIVWGIGFCVLHDSHVVDSMATSPRWSSDVFLYTT